MTYTVLPDVVAAGDVPVARVPPRECHVPLVSVRYQTPLFVPSPNAYTVLPTEVAAGLVPVAKTPPRDVHPVVRVLTHTP